MTTKSGQPAAAPLRRRKRRPTQEVTSLLLQAATEEFKRYGYATATTAAIAQKAGTTEAQLFRYFKSKAELFRESVFNELDRHFAEFNARNPSDDKPLGDVRALTGRYIVELQRFLDEHHALLLTLFVTQTYAPDASPGVVDVDSLRAYFERGAAIITRTAKSATPSIDPHLLVRISFGAVLASVMFRSWLFPPGLASEAQIEAAVIGFVLDGVSADFADMPTAPAAGRKRRPRTA